MKSNYTIPDISLFKNRDIFYKCDSDIKMIVCYNTYFAVNIHNRFLFAHHKASDTCVAEIAKGAGIPRLSRPSGKIFLPPLYYFLG